MISPYSIGPLLSGIQSYIQSHDRWLVVTDAVVLDAMHQADPKLHAWILQQPHYTVPVGEDCKTFAAYEGLLEAMTQAGLTRDSALIIVGGGAVLDVSGFASATYMRGIAYYSVPTTLLAMVDSAFGGKTGINAFQAKNTIGALHAPRHVWVDTALLQTLPLRQFRSGIAEILKYGLLNADLWQKLKSLEHPLSIAYPEIEYIIRQCIELKLSIVRKDPNEHHNVRAALNLGHTLGHAIEACSHYAYTHGEAVALGLRFIVRYSNLDATDCQQLDTFLMAYDLPLEPVQPLAGAALLECMHRDKKNTACDQLTLVTLPCIGQPVVQRNVPVQSVEACLESLGYVLAGSSLSL